MNKKKRTTDDVDNKDFATRIPFHAMEEYDEEEITAQKKKLKLQSPFAKLV